MKTVMTILKKSDFISTKVLSEIQRNFKCFIIWKRLIWSNRNEIKEKYKDYIIIFFYVNKWEFFFSFNKGTLENLSIDWKLI